MEQTDRKEILYYYESRQNPNGDPGFENMPRQMPDGTIMVTDVRVKRTIRDYAKNALKKTLFVDFGEKGLPVKADDRAKEIVGKELTPEKLKGLLSKTFDAPLFGALVTIRGKKRGHEEEDNTEEPGDSFKVTGPVQFGLGRSVNQVEIVNPSITGRFIGAKGTKHSTIGKFYSVDYALIKLQGVVNPSNLEEYWSDNAIRKNFEESEKLLFDCLWNGTNNLVTRSKYPQRSVFFLEVTYNGSLYNDLPLLVSESATMKGKTNQLDPKVLDFSRFVETMASRKKKVKSVHIASCEELRKAADELAKVLSKAGIAVETF